MTIDVTEIATKGANQVFDFGILGVFTVVMMAFIVFQYKENRREREKSDEAQREQINKMDEANRTQADEFRRTAEKMVDKLGDIARDANNHRGG